MAFAYSTIANALTATSTSVTLTSATGVTVSNYQGAGTALSPGTGVITYLLIEQEICQLVSGTNPYTIKRGMMGTRALSHQALTPFIFGLSTDFLAFRPGINAFTLTQPDTPTMGASVAVVAAASIIAPGPLFHLTGATGVTNMQPPTSALLSQTGPSSEENYVNGFKVTIITDSTPAFTAGGGGTGVAFAATVAAATAATFIEFILDTSSGTALWYPSRHST